MEKFRRSNRPLNVEKGPPQGAKAKPSTQAPLNPPPRESSAASPHFSDPFEQAAASNFGFAADWDTNDVFATGGGGGGGGGGGRGRGGPRKSGEGGGGGTVPGVLGKLRRPAPPLPVPSPAALAAPSPRVTFSPEVDGGKREEVAKEVQEKEEEGEEEEQQGEEEEGKKREGRATNFASVTPTSNKFASLVDNLTSPTSSSGSSSGSSSSSTPTPSPLPSPLPRFDYEASGEANKETREAKAAMQHALMSPPRTARATAEGESDPMQVSGGLERGGGGKKGNGGEGERKRRGQGRSVLVGDDILKTRYETFNGAFRGPAWRSEPLYGKTSDLWECASHETMLHFSVFLFLPFNTPPSVPAVTCFSRPPAAGESARRQTRSFWTRGESWFDDDISKTRLLNSIMRPACLLGDRRYGKTSDRQKSANSEV